MIYFKIVAKVQKKGGIYHIFEIAGFGELSFKNGINNMKWND